MTENAGYGCIGCCGGGIGCDCIGGDTGSLGGVGLGLLCSGFGFGCGFGSGFGCGFGGAGFDSTGGIGTLGGVGTSGKGFGCFGTSTSSFGAVGFLTGAFSVFFTCSAPVLGFFT